MKRGHPWSVSLCLLLSLVMLAPEARAYLDPSTGSMILSAIVGMFATAVLAVKTYWYKLKALFRRRQEPTRQDEPARDEEGADGGKPTRN